MSYLNWPLLEIMKPPLEPYLIVEFGFMMSRRRIRIVRLILVESLQISRCGTLDRYNIIHRADGVPAE